MCVSRDLSLCNMATNSRKKLGRRSQNDDEEGEPKKKRHRKVTNKKTRKTLQSSLESILSLALLEIRTRVDIGSGAYRHEFACNVNCIISIYYELRSNSSSQLKPIFSPIDTF